MPGSERLTVFGRTLWSYSFWNPRLHRIESLTLGVEAMSLPEDTPRESPIKSLRDAYYLGEAMREGTHISAEVLTDEIVRIWQRIQCLI